MKLLSEDETKVTPCDVSVSGTYLNIRGEDYMVLTVYDVTELKNAQRLLTIEREHSISADKLKSAFIANMGHEVRTPLNAIIISGMIKFIIWLRTYFNVTTIFKAAPVNLLLSVAENRSPNTTPAITPTRSLKGRL